MWERLLLVTCVTYDSTDFELFQHSCRAYANGLKIHASPGAASYGEAFERSVALGLAAHPDTTDLLIANDDIVLTPTTIPLLLEDVARLRRACPGTLGFVACRTNYARPAQNIGCIPKHLADRVFEAPAVSPILAHIAVDVLAKTDWPHCNWYSDDYMCWRLRQQGFRHFVSRSYMHHHGSRTVNRDEPDETKHKEAGIAWMRANRPAFFDAVLAKELQGAPPA